MRFSLIDQRDAREQILFGELFQQRFARSDGAEFGGDEVAVEHDQPQRREDSPQYVHRECLYSRRQTSTTVWAFTARYSRFREPGKRLCRSAKPQAAKNASRPRTQRQDQLNLATGPIQTIGDFAGVATLIGQRVDFRVTRIGLGHRRLGRQTCLHGLCGASSAVSDIAKSCAEGFPSS